MFQPRFGGGDYHMSRGDRGQMRGRSRPVVDELDSLILAKALSFV
jgi:hypothetical protein